MVRRGSSLLLLIAAVGALLVSPPFAAAYFRAYPGYETPPFWWADFRIAFPGLLDFADPQRVYQVYGRIYSLLIPLSLPAMIDLKRRLQKNTRFSMRAWRIFLGALLVIGLGIFGDYWPEQDSIWIGIGFVLGMLGMLVLWIVGFLLGREILKADAIPRWVGIGLIGFAPLGFVGMMLLAHIPSGPLFGYAVFSAVLGTYQLINGSPGAEPLAGESKSMEAG